MKLRCYTGFDGNVERIHADRGSHIEPPLDQRWSDLDKLRWHAAVAEADAGITIEVGPSQLRYKPPGSERWIERTDEFRINVALPGIYSSCISLRFYEAWTYINGAVAGARAARAVPNP